MIGLGSEILRLDQSSRRAATKKGRFALDSKNVRVDDTSHREWIGPQRPNVATTETSFEFTRLLLIISYTLSVDIPGHDHNVLSLRGSGRVGRIDFEPDE